MDAVEAVITALPERRQDEARDLDALYRDVTGWAPRVWGRNMIGYGQYAYTYDSGRSGEFMATGWGIGARQISLYILPGYSDFPDIAARLGKHKRGKSCWYLTKLDAADPEALRDLIRAGLDDLASQWPVTPT